MRTYVSQSVFFCTLTLVRSLHGVGSSVLRKLLSQQFRPRKETGAVLLVQGLSEKTQSQDKCGLITRSLIYIFDDFDKKKISRTRTLC